MEWALRVYVQHFNMHTHLKRHHRGVTITVAVEKKTSCANPAHDTISTTPVWEFRNANAITKFIGVFIVADLRPFSVVNKKAVFFNFPLNYELYRTVPCLKNRGTYQTVALVYRYTPSSHQ